MFSRSSGADLMYATLIKIMSTTRENINSGQNSCIKINYWGQNYCNKINNSGTEFLYQNKSLEDIIPVLNK